MRKLCIPGLLLAALTMGPATAEPWKKLGEGEGYISQSHGTLRVSQAPQEASRVVDVAKTFAGLPYVWAGHDPTSGFDCSGYVYEVMRLNGYEVPRMADEQFHETDRVAYKDLKPGDLVFFHTYLPGPSHVGFYLGNSEFIHSSSAAEGVVVSRMDSGYYRERFLGGGRPDGWQDGPLPVAEVIEPAADLAHVALEQTEETLPVAVAEELQLTNDPFARRRMPQPVRSTVVPEPANLEEAAMEDWSLLLGESVAAAELQMKGILSALSAAFGSVKPGV